MSAQADADISGLVERWVAGINAMDVDAVIAEHTEDIVMFDVPPPFRGVRGIAAYRDSWPPFFEFIASGAVFDLEELTVVAGDTAAFAYALVRCGRPDQDLARQPDQRLRISLGLRNVDGHWLIAHEHHSFPSVD